MTQVVFASPSHANGCIFADPTVVDDAIDRSRAVFANPSHANGCIFANPFDFSTAIPVRRKSNRFQQKVRENRELLLREDEEILAVIVSYMLH